MLLCQQLMNTSNLMRVNMFNKSNLEYEVEKLLSVLEESRKLKEESRKLKEVRKKNKKTINELISKRLTLIYKKEYGKMPEDSKYLYLVSTYYATGEGTTVCLLMTQAEPCEDEDFCDTIPNKYDNPVTTKQYRAVREFSEKFDKYYLDCAEFLPKQEFFNTYSNHIPQSLKNLRDTPGQKSYHSELHVNFF